MNRLIKAVRRNHALEHATIAVLLNRQGPVRVIGRAAPDGFWVYGRVPTERLREFAEEALARLQRGESHLAVSPLCGTNIAVAGVLAGVGAYLAAGSGRNSLERLTGAVAASIVGVLAAQPLGRLVQQRYTTSPDLDGVRILSVEPRAGGLAHRVRTGTGPAEVITPEP